MPSTDTALPGQMHPASEIVTTTEGGRSHAVAPKSHDGLLRTIEHSIEHYLREDREFSVYVGDHAQGDVDDAVAKARSRHRGWTVIPINSSAVPGVSNPLHQRVIVLRFKLK